MDRVAVPSGVDPYEVLGVASGASPAEIAASYRRLAKRWHPDRAPAEGAADRMALINAAYDVLRGPGSADRVPGGGEPPGRPTAAGPAAGTPWADPGPPRRRGRAEDPLRGGDHRTADDRDAPRGAGPGGWVGGAFEPDDGPPADDGLAPAVRAALGRELHAALRPGERVGIVVPAATWASPQTTLAVTDRRLLWLLDDAPVHRVRTMRGSDVADVRVRPPRPWRRGWQVVVTDQRRRRTTFGDLAEATAAAVARRTGATAAAAERTPRRPGG